MGPLWLYTIVLGILVIMSIRHQWNFAGKMLLLLYTAIAVFAMLVPTMGQLAYVRRLDPEDVTYGMMIFLLISFTIYFSPFLKKREIFTSQKMDIALNRNYYIFAAVYIVLCIITIILYFQPLMQIIRSGAWAVNRKFMASEEAVYPYHNFLEKIIINCTSYFRILALIVGMLLIQGDEDKRLGYLTVIAASVCEVCTDLYVSSRGLLATYILLLIALFMFFFPELTKKNRIRIVLIGVVAGVLIFPYLIDITINRFTTSSNISLIYYFGQPPYGFAREVQDLKYHLYGRFAFGTLFGDVKFPAEFSSWVHGFYTFVGWLYADWGYIGTIIIGIIVAMYFSSKINKEKYSMADLFLVFSYYKLLVEGVFTIGRTKSNMIVITIFIYLILKCVMDKYRFTINKR